MILSSLDAVCLTPPPTGFALFSGLTSIPGRMIPRYCPALTSIHDFSSRTKSTQGPE